MIRYKYNEKVWRSSHSKAGEDWSMLRVLGAIK
jgi:hypothetical protein